MLSVWHHTARANPLWLVTVEWLECSSHQWVTAAGIQHMKQFAYNWNLLCYQCKETCSPAYKNTYIYIYIPQKLGFYTLIIERFMVCANTLIHNISRPDFHIRLLEENTILFSLCRSVWNACQIYSLECGSKIMSYHRYFIMEVKRVIVMHSQDVNLACGFNNAFFVSWPYRQMPLLTKPPFIINPALNPCL